MSELDQVREMVERDGLQEFVEFAPVAELIAKQDAEIDRLRAEVGRLRKRPSEEELARTVRDTVMAEYDKRWKNDIGERVSLTVARAVLRILEADANV